jgi:hypothetical protein
VTIEFVNDMGHPDDAVRAAVHRDLQADPRRRRGGDRHHARTSRCRRGWATEHPRGKETRATVEVLRKLTPSRRSRWRTHRRRWEHLEAEGLPYTTLLVNGINHPTTAGTSCSSPIY